MDDRRRDPDAPLPAAPDPWAGSEMPSPRAAPPWHMTEMIEAEPALAERLLRRLADDDGAAASLAAAVRDAAVRGGPLLVTGCGTSEHGALAMVEILREAMRTAGLPSRPGEPGAPVAAQAFEAALEEGLGARGLVIGVSHEGGTWATNRALEAAKRAGGTAAIVTCSSGSPGATLADIVLTTDEQDQSWCHTVGYLAPILAAVGVAGHLTGRPADPAAVRSLLAAGLAPEAIRATEALAEGLAEHVAVIVSGTGADRVAARELVLKLEEGTHTVSAMRDLETVLHGHLAGMAGGGATGFVLILADEAASEDRARRAAGVLRAVASLGIEPGAILLGSYGEAIPAELTPAGRVLIPSSAGLGRAAAALLGTTVPLQLLTERLARRLGINPDPIRRDDPRYLAAAEAAG